MLPSLLQRPPAIHLETEMTLLVDSISYQQKIDNVSSVVLVRVVVGTRVWRSRSLYRQWMGGDN
jgi:hypothetical protein